jgi:serine/threonine protein phosphatase 1
MPQETLYNVRMKIDNTLENTYIIGDVHGCYHTLQNLIARLPSDAELIFVGDLCDKGHYSKEVIEFVMHGGYACVKGNHEHLMEKYLHDAVYHDIHSPWSTDYRYGGISTYESYLNDHETMQRHLAWIAEMPMYLQIDNYFITHGFALPFYAHRDDEAYYNDFLLHRYEEGMEVPSSEVVNIFGHCKFEEVVRGEHFYGIDTGCAYGNKLTALQLGTMQLIQEPMDVRDSDYTIVEMRLHHIEEAVEKKLHLPELVAHIDSKFEQFDLVSTEVASHIVSTYGEDGVATIYEMLEKKQLFIKQAKKVVEGFEEK